MPRRDAAARPAKTVVSTSRVESSARDPLHPRACRRRRRYIDWARGIAVLIMIEAHTLDAWTRPADRSSPAFGYLIILGGFAAPLFLWLAGLGLVLSAERVLAEPGRRIAAAEAVVRRGARDLHPRVSLPPSGVHRQPGQLAGHALPRRHPERHGPGDGRWPGSSGAFRETPPARRRSRAGCWRRRSRW